MRSRSTRRVHSIKLSHDLEVSAIPELFSSDTADEILRKYLLDTQLFAKRFREGLRQEHALTHGGLARMS